MVKLNELRTADEVHRDAMKNWRYRIKWYLTRPGYWVWRLRQL